MTINISTGLIDLPVISDRLRSIQARLHRENLSLRDRFLLYEDMQKCKNDMLLKVEPMRIAAEVIQGCQKSDVLTSDNQNAIYTANIILTTVIRQVDNDLASFVSKLKAHEASLGTAVFEFAHRLSDTKVALPNAAYPFIFGESAIIMELRNQRFLNENTIEALQLDYVNSENEKFTVDLHCDNAKTWRAGFSVCQDNN